MSALPTPPPAGQADLDAARLLLARMGLSPDDLVHSVSSRPPAPTFADYIPVVSTAVSQGTRRVYGTYWNRVGEAWGHRRLDEPSPSEIHQLSEHIRARVVVRRNARGGRGAAEHLIAALRCLYAHAIADGLLTEAQNPAVKVAKPRRLPSTRRAVPDTRLAEINRVAAATGNDPALDTLLLRLHTETACRRGGALALRPQDLDTQQCLIFLREKGDTVRWQPVSPTLMAHLHRHAEHRHAPPARPTTPIYQRPADHHPALRPPLVAYRYPPALGRHPTDLHPLATPHHPDPRPLPMVSVYDELLARRGQPRSRQPFLRRAQVRCHDRSPPAPHGLV
ncbi:MAG: tyrosine-type recombinase/integrase [Sciscionella sp.]